MLIKDNSFFTEHKKSFSGKPVKSYYLNLAFEFGYEMCFGSGHHRDHRSGGSAKRKRVELFANAFQGKMAEFCVYDYCYEEKIEASFPDISIHGKGTWDDSDLVIENKKVSVKSMAHFSNLLLLETKDYNKDGGYLPNHDVINDMTLAVRLKPDLKAVFRKERILYNDSVEKTELKKLIDKNDWFYDLPGGITKVDFKKIISANQVIPKGALLNGKLPMDAENYYCELGLSIGLKLLI